MNTGLDEKLRTILGEEIWKYSDIPHKIELLIREEKEKSRLKEIDFITKKYGAYNDGCGCCSSETIREWNNDTDSYSGTYRSQWLKNRVAKIQESLKEVNEKLETEKL